MIARIFKLNPLQYLKEIYADIYHLKHESDRMLVEIVGGATLPAEIQAELPLKRVWMLVQDEVDE
jgi:hypothetical protein